MSRPSRRKATEARQRYDEMEEEMPPAPKRAAPSSFYVTSVGGASPIRRIRQPHPHDILCGRGGSINNHVGNKVFRDWVHERKDHYNLAVNKQEKARVSREVINLVKNQDPPGRFLTRDPNSPAVGAPWWIEIDDVKAMAKTSQALREGAPAIRAKHKDTLEENKRRGSSGSGTTSRRASTRRSSATEAEPERESTPEPPLPAEKQASRWAEPASAAFPEPERRQMPPPPVVAMSNEMAIEALRTAAEAAKHGLGVPVDEHNAVVLDHHDDEEFQQPFKRVRTHEPSESSETETPPLMPVSGEEPKYSINLSAIQKADRMNRAHSLALSDINDGDLDFVNPFEEESNHSDLFRRPSDESNHSFDHMSFSSLPKLSSSDLSRNRTSNGTNDNGSPFHKTVSSRSVSIDNVEGTSKSAASKNCICECGNPLLEGGVCPCGALADHMVWRDDHIEDEDWLHISGFMDQIVPVSP